MRGALLEKGSNRLEVVNDLEIREPVPGEVLVRVAYCGLCHSDLWVKESSPTEDVPVVLGHEAAGEVVDVGEGVSVAAVGDHVVLSTLPSCGRCPSCLRGHPAACERNGHSRLAPPLPSGKPVFTHRGREVHRGLGVGGFAEYTLATPDSFTVLPPDTPLDIACLLGCGVRTGVGAVLNTAQVPEGASVLIMGLGGVGLSMVMGAVLAAACPIIVSDPIQSRRQAALSFGATTAVDPTTDDLADAVHEATAGRGVQFAFDAAGSADLLRTGFDVISIGGTVVSVGAAFGDLTIPALQLMSTEKRIIGSLVGSSVLHRDVPRLLRLWQAGRLPLDQLVSNRRPIEQINAGFDDMTAGRELRTVATF
jgi:Zn-dependent alcohol dehydrogenase